jgi:hypothetical protein
MLVIMGKNKLVPFERFKAEVKKKGKIIPESIGAKETENEGVVSMKEFANEKELKRLAHKVGLPETAPRREILDALKQQETHAKLMTPEEITDPLKKKEIIDALKRQAPELNDKLVTPEDYAAVSIRKFEPTAKERPKFSPRQIEQLSQIKAGERYQEYHFDRIDPEKAVPSKRSTFVVTSEPYEKNGSWAVMVKRQMRREQEEIDLADYGVVPYKSGHWNPANWIEPI